MNHKNLIAIVCTAITLSYSTPAWAHHAREYLKVGSPETVHQGRGFAYVSAEYAFSEVDNDESFNLEVTPGLIYGVLDHLQVDTHFHTLDVAEEESSRGLFIESFALDGTWRFLEEPRFPVDAALNVEYEQPTFTGRTVGGTDPRIVSRLMLRKELPFECSAALNVDWLADVHGEDRENQWGFAAAFKHTVTDWLAIGLEGFNPSDAQGFSILPGIYLGQPHGGWQWKAGLQIGLTRQADDLAILTTLGYQF